MNSKKAITGYYVTVAQLDADPKAYSYIMDSKEAKPVVIYKYFLTELAKIYGLDPCFYFDEDGIFIILDHINIPTYDDFVYGLEENKTYSIIDNKENIVIIYSLFSDIEV